MNFNAHQKTNHFEIVNNMVFTFEAKLYSFCLSSGNLRTYCMNSKVIPPLIRSIVLFQYIMSITPHGAAIVVFCLDDYNVQLMLHCSDR